jgi:cytoskeletal protein CcmA (bactofilin family)
MKKTARKGIAMFGKEGESMADEGKMNSIIGKGCKVTGTIDVQDGTLRIDGDFEGSVNCPGGTVVIGKGGKIKADIKVSSAIVGGTVNGNIDAREKIELQAGSRLEGDIKTRRLVIDEGVFFEGSCRMSPDGKPVSSQPAQQPEAKKDEKEKTGAWNK